MKTVSLLLTLRLFALGQIPGTQIRELTIVDDGSPIKNYKARVLGHEPIAAVDDPVATPIAIAGPKDLQVGETLVTCFEINGTSGVIVTTRMKSSEPKAAKADCAIVAVADMRSRSKKTHREFVPPVQEAGAAPAIPELSPPPDFALPALFITSIPMRVLPGPPRSRSAIARRSGNDNPFEPRISNWLRHLIGR